MLILRRTDVEGVLDKDPDSVLETVRRAYVAHARGQTSVPHSVFLRFPGNTRDRIIALPAYVGGERPVAAVKWIASFPANIDAGVERASAVIVLSSVTDGRPRAVLEGAVISARRTAAGAVLAAEELTVGAPETVRSGMSFVGCGVINFEVLRFARHRLPRLREVAVFDLDPARAEAFAERARGQWPEMTVTICEDVERAMASHRLVSLATTAGEPHLTIEACRPGTVVLHVSLRDLTVESILAARNVVDDVDHVCRAATSLDLAARATGNRDFVHAEIGALLDGTTRLPYDEDAVTVFSPFGLGCLDAALAAYTLDEAVGRGLGIDIPDFVD